MAESAMKVGAVAKAMVSALVLFFDWPPQDEKMNNRVVERMKNEERRGLRCIMRG